MTIARPLALGWYASFTRRNLFLIADCALLGIIVAVVLIGVTPPSYRGTVTVVLSVLPSTHAEFDPAGRSRTIDFDAQLAGSATVLQVAATKSGFPGGWTALARSLRLSARPNAHALRIRVRAHDRRIAIAAADAIGTELLWVRQETLEKRLEDRRTILHQQLKLMTTQLSTPLPTSERGRLTEQLSNLQLILAEVEAQSSDPGFVAGPAAGSRGGRPGLQAKLASGLMLGTLFGVGLATLIEGARSARNEKRARQRRYPGLPASRAAG